ncbi:MAG: hypothetical protein IH991_22895 [Planctomycetes bacterium]|nr:hypothetical protein [Planctomycetota bacterium]
MSEWQPIKTPPKEAGHYLAWDLGQRLPLADVDSVRALANEVRRVDPNDQRPLLCNPATGIWAYSRFSDILILGRAPIGSSFDLSNMAGWLRSRMLLSRGGRPFWGDVQTEPSEALLRQVVALSPEARTFALEPDQIRMLAFEVIASGARGLAFRSRTRLDANDRATWLRAATLQLLNLELSLIEPWVSGGTYLGEIKTSHPSLLVSVLRTERSRLLIVRRHQAGQQFVGAAPENRVISFVDAGATSSATAFQIQPGAGATAVDFQRQPDGVRITMKRPRRISLIVVSSDPLVRRFVGKRTQSDFLHVAESRLRLATEWHAETERIRSLRPRASVEYTAASDVRAILQQSQRLLASRDAQAADDFANRAMWPIAQTRRVDWQEAIRGFSTPSSSPFCTSYSTLPVHWKLTRQMSSVRWSPNMLPGGDSENLNFMRDQGWHNNVADEPEVESSVRLLPQAAHAGKFGLQLRVALAADQSEIPAALETEPIQITTAPVLVRAGQLVRVHGWLNVRMPIQGSLDGLMIRDSIGGVELAQRVWQPNGWQPFTFYRVATRDGRFTTTFVLSGIGEVWLDDISVQTADLPRSNQGF